MYNNILANKGLFLCIILLLQLNSFVIKIYKIKWIYIKYKKIKKTII